MKNIEISVLMTIYNPPTNYLKKAIESIISQTYKQIEIILILDGCNKQTEDICIKYQKIDNRINIYKQENKGDGASRNKAIELAQKEYITFVDHDDYLEENILEEVVKKLQKEKEKPDIVIFDAFIEYEKKQIKNSFYNKTGILNEKDIEEIQLQNIEKGESKYFPDECNISVQWGRLYNREFLLKNNLKFPEGTKIKTDTIHTMFAFEKAKNIIHYSLYGYHYRKIENSITNKRENYTDKNIKQFLNILQEYIQEYHKGDRFKHLADMTVLKMMSEKIENDLIFQKDIEIKKWIDNFLKDNKYDKALYNLEMNPKGLSKYKRILLYTIQKRNIRLMKLIYRIKKTIKKIQKKECQKVKQEELKIESLISIMNLKDVKEVENFIKNANITENVLFINQVKEEKDVFNYEDVHKRIYSFAEKGVSKSRNLALKYANCSIGILGDDDIKYEKDYKKLILDAYQKNKKADVIIFYVESKNKNRPLKKIRKGKLFWPDIMKAVSSEITFKLEKIREKDIRFNENFGPGGTFSKGEDTIFLHDCYKKKLKIYSVPIKIGSVENKKSTWFRGYDEKFFYDQGAIFKQIQPKFYKILILQFIIRKKSLYKNRFTMKEIYNFIINGASKEIN